MTARIKIWVIGATLTVSTIISPLLINAGSVRAIPTKETKRPNIIDRLIFFFKGGEKQDKPRASQPGSRRTRGAGSRGYECEVDVVALMPKYNLGVTMSDKPIFWFYIPNSTIPVESLEFTLSGSQIQKLIDKPQQLRPGLLRVQYQGKPLLDGSHNWELSYKQLGCANAQILSGVVTREIHPDLVIPADPIDRLRTYAKNGIWHELLTELITLRKGQPKNPQLATDFKSLLESEDVKYLLPTNSQKPNSKESDRELIKNIVNAKVIN